MLTGSSQKARSRLPHLEFGAHGHRTAGIETGANSFVLLESNMANPSLRHRVVADTSARIAHGTAGRGCWKKRRPVCNGTDRSTAPPRKRADFQRVVRDEKTGRTFTGGNRK